MKSIVNNNERPYRSHRKPACGSCRKRKSRCSTGQGSNTCVTCQLHGTNCDFEQIQARLDSETNSGSPPRPVKRKISSKPPLESSVLDQETSYEGTSAELQVILSESKDHGSHVVSPAMAEDNDILARYFSSLPEENPIYPPTHSSLLQAEAHKLMKPVLFVTVPKRPIGVVGGRSLAYSKCEIIENILGHNLDSVIELFFNNANICFPIFEENSFRETFKNHKEQISPAVLANLYANTVSYWNVSDTNRPRPKQKFIWIQANEALYYELYNSPGIATVIAIILNICGRPSTSLFGNGGLMGMAVAISHALGLNRDSSSWAIPSAEKAFRSRIWWLVVTMDLWCSLAYGTPRLIQETYHDAPIPNKNDLYFSGLSLEQALALRIFLAFISLTQVLGKYLDGIYHIAKEDAVSIATLPAELEATLVEWEESLDDDIRRIALRGSKSYTPGAANFRLAYLGIKFILRRRQCELEGTRSTISNSSYDLQAQRAAEDIVHHIQELDESDLKGFWIPMVSSILTLVTTYLLRTAVKMDRSGRSRALRLAREIVDCLQSYQSLASWDIADDCLSRCQTTIEKLESEDDRATHIGQDPPDFTFAEELLNESRLFSDFAFTDLWDLSAS